MPVGFLKKPYKKKLGDVFQASPIPEESSKKARESLLTLLHWMNLMSLTFPMTKTSWVWRTGYVVEGSWLRFESKKCLGMILDFSIQVWKKKWIVIRHVVNWRQLVGPQK